MFLATQGDAEEDEAEGDNGEREVLPARDAAPQRRVRLAEALGDDARGCVHEAKEGGEDAGRRFFPRQSQGDEHDEDEQAFAQGFEKLGGVARGEVVAERIAHALVLAGEAEDGVVGGFGELALLIDGTQGIQRGAGGLLYGLFLQRTIHSGF